MSGRLFISHASGDAKVAGDLCTALEGRGFDCWLASRDVAPGENFQVAIVRAIRGARMLLLIFTGAANTSDEVAKELALASQAKIAVVPLKVEDVPPSEALAYEFATRQWIDFHTDWSRAVEQLARHVSTTLGDEAPAAAGAASSAAPASPPSPSPPPWPATGRPTPGDPRGGRSRERPPRDRDDENRRGGRVAEYAVGLALERAKARRSARSATRSVFDGVRTLLVLVGIIVFFVVLLPWLKRLADNTPTTVGAHPPAASAPASTAPSNSEVPF